MFVLLTGLLVGPACSRETAGQAASGHAVSARRLAAGGAAAASAGDTMQSDAASLVARHKTEPAELFVSLTTGAVMWWRSDGTLVRELENTIQGPAFGMAFDASSNLYVAHGYTADLAAGNAIEVFDPGGARLGTFGSGYDCNPHSIAFDAMARAYVGQADCGGDILQFDAAGTLLESFDVATEQRGSLWIALADDPCTVAYTSQGSNVKRYDICSRTQLPDFNQASLPVDTPQGSGANEIKFLSDGGLIVANFTEIVRLDAAGIQLRVYDVPGPDGWRGLDLDLSGTSFWAVNYSTSDVVRFDIESGDVIDQFNTGTDALTVKSVAVKRSPTN
jgi:hypothetical protein